MNKLFVGYTEANFQFPEDVKTIRDYVKSRGEFLADIATLESLFYQFSDERYGTQWLTNPDETVLEEFVEWLEDYDLDENIEILKSYMETSNTW